MNETKFADSSEEESLGRFAQYIDYPKEMPFHNMRFACGDPGSPCTQTRKHCQLGSAAVRIGRSPELNWRLPPLLDIS